MTCSGDSSLRMWNLKSGQQIGKDWRDGKSGVYAITLSPDGKQLVSGSDDGAVRLWDIASLITRLQPTIGRMLMYSTAILYKEGNFQSAALAHNISALCRSSTPSASHHTSSADYRKGVHAFYGHLVLGNFQSATLAPPLYSISPLMPTSLSFYSTCCCSSEVVTVAFFTRRIMLMSDTIISSSLLFHSVICPSTLPVYALNHHSVIR
ncbi:hypothetical protein K503DRAFT_866619, partial [Rhizopogon vinicolor AM-OR11-026]